MRPAFWFIAIMVLTGCQGFHRERSAEGIHLFGIGWIYRKTATNEMRIFSIGNFSSVNYRMNINTNAPLKINRLTRPPATPLGIPIQTP